MDAIAAVLPPKIPQVKDKAAINTKATIYIHSSFTSETTSILSTNLDITNGKAHSMAASPTINKGVNKAGTLYSRTLFKISLIFFHIIYITSRHFYLERRS